MKTIKLLVSLVTLLLLGVITLNAAEPREFRTWTDISGRQITARLVSSDGRDIISIQRADGNVFQVSLSKFSQADRDYIKTATAKPAKDAEASANTLVDATDVHWQKLRMAGSHPASLYDNTALEEILTQINQRLLQKNVKTEEGDTVSLRTEPAELAGQLHISGQMPSMGTVDFLKRIAYNYNLAMKVDSSGNLILVDKNAAPPATFFGVTAN